MLATKARFWAVSFTLYLDKTTFKIRPIESQMEEGETHSSHCIFALHKETAGFDAVLHIENEAIFTPGAEISLKN